MKLQALRGIGGTDVLGEGGPGMASFMKLRVSRPGGRLINIPVVPHEAVAEVSRIGNV